MPCAHCLPLAPPCAPRTRACTQSVRRAAGNIFLVDFNEHRIIEDAELKQRYTGRQPYAQWLDDNAFTLPDILSAFPRRPHTAANTLPTLEESIDEDNIIPILPSGFPMPGAKELVPRGGKFVDPVTEILPWLRAFGYTREALELLTLPMAASGAEPLGSMGNDAPLAVLSRTRKLVPEYFKQLFAQVRRRAFDLCRLCSM